MTYTNIEWFKRDLDDITNDVSDDIKRMTYHMTYYDNKWRIQWSGHILGRTKPGQSGSPLIFYEYFSIRRVIAPIFLDKNNMSLRIY